MIDLSFLKQFTKGNESKMKRYISMYLKIAPGVFEQMEKNVEDQDWESLAVNAHSLKPQADYMGIKELKEILIEVENKVRAGEFAHLDILYREAKERHISAAILLAEHLE